MPAFAPPYDDDLELLRSTAVAAGIIASSYFRRDIKTWTKDNASPVSEADIVVDRFLAANLLQARPSYGWLSEETVDNPSRLDCERVFVVDPIDGTRAFLRGEDYWTVSLAVVENGVAVAGVVYAPARDELYDAYKGGGARLNGKPLTRSRGPGPRHLFPLREPCIRNCRPLASIMRAALLILRWPTGWCRSPPESWTPPSLAAVRRIGISPVLQRSLPNADWTLPMSAPASHN